MFITITIGIETFHNVNIILWFIYIFFYRPYELSLLSEVYAYKISHSVRDFMPHFTTSFSPFAVRIRPGRRREETGNKNLNMKNPSMTGQSSTSSTTSSAR